MWVETGCDEDENALMDGLGCAATVTHQQSNEAFGGFLQMTTGLRWINVCLLRHNVDRKIPFRKVKNIIKIQ